MGQLRIRYKVDLEYIEIILIRRAYKKVERNREKGVSNGINYY